MTIFFPVHVNSSYNYDYSIDLFKYVRLQLDSESVEIRAKVQGRLSIFPAVKQSKWDAVNPDPIITFYPRKIVFFSTVTRL